MTVRCSRQQPLTAVGLSQRGVREAGQGRVGAERGPSSSPLLLLLFCCFSAAPILARSLARSLCKDPEEEQEEEQERVSGRRTSEKIYNKAFFCSLACCFFLRVKIQTLARVFFFFFDGEVVVVVLFFHRLERLVCLCLCVLLG